MFSRSSHAVTKGKVFLHFYGRVVFHCSSIVSFHRHSNSHLADSYWACEQHVWSPSRSRAGCWTAKDQDEARKQRMMKGNGEEGGRVNPRRRWKETHPCPSPFLSLPLGLTSALLPQGHQPLPSHTLLPFPLRWKHPIFSFYSSFPTICLSWWSLFLPILSLFLLLDSLKAVLLWNLTIIYKSKF